MDQIQVLDNGDGVYVDVRSICYSNGVIGGPQRITMSRDIGGRDPRTVNVTIQVTTTVEHEQEHIDLVDQLKKSSRNTVDNSLNLSDFIKK
jgi:hypothetical protein